MFVRKGFVLLACVFCIASLFAGKASIDEQEPSRSLYFFNPIGEEPAPDPFVTYDAERDWYYLLATEGSAVRIRRARRPECLLKDGEAKTLFVTNAALGIYRHLWAPEMHRAPNGKWYVYTSADTTPGPEWKLRLVCLESESADPFDGFHFKSFPLPDVDAIDPTVLWTDVGRGYLAFAHLAKGGERLAIAELENPWTCRGKAVEIAEPTKDWEKKRGSILEGPFFVKGPDGNLFLTYSANDTRCEDYAVGALQLSGTNLLDAASWKKRREPILFKENGVYGPGHASFFRTRGGELWCAYHGMDKPDGPGPLMSKPRRMYLQPADPDDDGCPHLSGSWGRGPHRVPDAPKEALPPLPAGAFTYAVIPDTQRYGGDGAWRMSFTNWPTCNAAFESRVSWIVKHAKEQNVVFVTHVGDITDCDNDPQYLFASNQMARLDGIVPWRTAAGNHDMVDKTGDTKNFERWFGSPNRVDLFEAGGMKFVLVTIVCNAPEEVMRWADEQLDRYADRKAIVCTHAYLGPIDPKDRRRYASRDPKIGGYERRIPDARLGRMPWLSSFGKYATSEGVGHSGETMWRDHLSKHANLFLIVCGDQSAVVSQHLVDRGVHGNVVHAFMQDYPRDNDRFDPIRLFRFVPSERRVDVFTVMAGENVLCTRAKFLEEHHRFSFEFPVPAADPTNGVRLSAGFARADMTPAPGGLMPGYFKVRVSTGARDPLEANVLALSDGAERALVITIDCVDMPDDFAEEVRKAISERTGVAREAILVHATHTHTGGDLRRTANRLLPADRAAEMRHRSEAYARETLRALVGAAERSLADLRPARLSGARTHAPRISFGRRYRMKDGRVRTNPGVGNPDIVGPAGNPPDDEVQVLRIDREGADPIAVLNFQTHPDVIGGERLSADWPGFARRDFERLNGGRVRCLLINGTQGDVNHVCVNPTPDEAKLLHPDFDDVPRGYAYAERMGERIADAAEKVWTKTAALGTGPIRFGERTIRVPSNRPKPEEMAEARKIDALHRAGRDAELPYKGMDLTTQVAGAERKLRLEHGPDSFELPLSAIAVGDAVAFGGFPGEPFNDIGKAVKKRSPFGMTILACLTNGDRGYFPFSDCYAEGGYESESSPFGPSVADDLIRGQLDLLNHIGSKK